MTNKSTRQVNDSKEIEVKFGDFEKNGYIMKDVTVGMVISLDNKIVDHPIMQFNRDASRYEAGLISLPDFSFVENEEVPGHFALMFSEGVVTTDSAMSYLKYIEAANYFCNQINEMMDSFLQNMQIAN
jgi:hypothetical protein